MTIKYTIAMLDTQLEPLRVWLASTAGRHWMTAERLIRWEGNYNTIGGEQVCLIELDLTFQRDADAVEFFMVWSQNPEVKIGKRGELVLAGWMDPFVV